MQDARTWGILLLSSLFVATATLAQQTAGEPYQPKTVVLPFASYMPETRWMFGGMLMYQFKPRGAGHETRASQILSSGIYTLNRQLIIEILPNVILSEEQWFLEGVYQYVYFPDNYWGVGPHTRKDAQLGVEYRRFTLQQAALRQIAPNLYAGPRFRWNKLSKISFTDAEDNPVPSETIDGGESSTLPGWGFSVRWDKRNSITAPTENHFLELTTLFYPRFLGATHPHQSWQFDGRKYFDLRNDQRSVLAFQFRLRMTHGDLPFQEYALLGGREIMRGYYEGRFRDANAAQLQAEFRQHLFGRFGMAVFLAAGEVWGQFENFSLDNPKIAGGAGIRFNLNPEDTSNIRLDYGIGRHDRGFYVTIGEAF